MAAESVATIIGGGSAVPDLSGRAAPRSSQAPASAAASGQESSSSSTASASGTNGGSGKTDSSASQGSQSSASGSSASGSGNASSTATGSKTSGKGRSSGTGRRGARTSAASKSGSPQAATQQAAQTAADDNDFSAALAQSLAATPTGTGATATPSAADGKAAAKSDTDAATDSSSNQGGVDPASSALSLMEQALAAALAGTQASAAASASAASATAASTSDTSSTAGSTIGTSGTSGAATLDILLTQSLTSDPKAGGANTAAGNGVSATAATGTAAAALAAAAQLPAASHLGSHQTQVDSAASTLASQVGTSDWAEELGTKLTWMAHQGIQSASLQLSPEHLGPLQVSISVHEGQASVWFGAAQADTRTALQQSLPQLRQLFASQGLNLADAGVSREPPRGQGRQSSARSAAPLSGIGGVSLETSDTRTSVTGGLGLLDTYA